MFVSHNAFSHREFETDAFLLVMPPQRAADEPQPGADPSGFGACGGEERRRRQGRGALRGGRQEARQLAESALGQVLQFGQRPEVSGLEQVPARPSSSQQPLDLSHGQCISFAYQYTIDTTCHVVRNQNLRAVESNSGKILPNKYGSQMGNLICCGP